MEIDGGFKNKLQKCSYCGRTFRVEHLDSEITDENVEYCTYCGSSLHDGNELSNDELLAQIEEAHRGE